MRKLPLVTILMTAYNAEQFVGAALESLINQTYQNLQIIVIDDASEDQTAEIIKELAARDSRLELFSLKHNLGPSLAANFGLKKAKGKFIARMDADDIAFADRIERQVEFLKAHPEVVLVGGQCLLINKEDEIIGEKSFPCDHETIYRSLYTMNPAQHPTCMINLQLLPERQFSYSHQQILAHDLEFVFELSQYGKLANLPEAILYYRQTAGSLSLKNPKKTFAATLAVRRQARRYHYYPTLKSRLISFLQRLVVLFLPEQLIYPIFQKIRFRKLKTDGARKGIAQGWQNAFTGNLLREVPS